MKFSNGNVWLAQAAASAAAAAAQTAPPWNAEAARTKVGALGMW